MSPTFDPLGDQTYACDASRSMDTTQTRDIPSSYCCDVFFSSLRMGRGLLFPADSVFRF